MVDQLSYAVSGFSAQFKDDGTRTFITLTLVGADAVRFYVPLDGASVLAAQINMVCRKMAEMMIASGTAEKKYGAKTVEMPNPFRVLSARSGLSEDRSIFAMSLQTDAHPDGAWKITRVASDRLRIDAELLGHLLKRDEVGLIVVRVEHGCRSPIAARPFPSSADLRFQVCGGEVFGRPEMQNARGSLSSRRSTSLHFRRYTKDP